MIWIARDADNTLWLYTGKPVRVGNRFEYPNGVAIQDIPWVSGQVEAEWFEEVTWENSPVQLVPKFEK